ncbi:AAA family ATPase [Luteipulveratus halotolerans]|uniref:Kinase n=1 Tax=Luteipulveratus halotolerans TaxID=1631356 RepID=A0A0L6CGJ7_9MICO|nr:AAA family ATPase [Luteipulveratus halotolerans]KNX36643.1 hypothetical protein VV01_04930 [Luteipulveratus halotolerans]
MRTPTGTARTQLVVLRGNSGSGKSTLATALRERPMSVVQQDHVRRIMLHEDGSEATPETGVLLDRVVRFCLDRGKDVVLEGILDAARYRPVITALLDDHVGLNHVYYLDVRFEETVLRHGTRPERFAFSAEQMREWYRPHDVLGVDDELVVGADSSFAQTLARIADALDAGAARTT